MAERLKLWFLHNEPCRGVPEPRDGWSGAALGDQSRQGVEAERAIPADVDSIIGLSVLAEVNAVELDVKNC